VKSEAIEGAVQEDEAIVFLNIIPFSAILSIVGEVLRS